MIPKLEECRPGVRPIGYTVLVALDVMEERTSGGIIIPEKPREREDSAADKGRIVDISGMAFKGGDWEGISTPEKGQVVFFQRYAGNEIEGEDGRKYRIVSDADLKAVYA